MHLVHSHLHGNPTYGRQRTDPCPICRSFPHPPLHFRKWDQGRTHFSKIPRVASGFVSKTERHVPSSSFFFTLLWQRANYVQRISLLIFVTRVVGYAIRDAKTRRACGISETWRFDGRGGVRALVAFEILGWFRSFGCKPARATCSIDCINFIWNAYIVLEEMHITERSNRRDRIGLMFASCISLSTVHLDPKACRNVRWKENGTEMTLYREKERRSFVTAHSSSRYLSTRFPPRVLLLLHSTAIISIHSFRNNISGVGWGKRVEIGLKWVKIYILQGQWGSSSQRTLSYFFHRPLLLLPSFFFGKAPRLWHTVWRMWEYFFGKRRVLRGFRGPCNPFCSPRIRTKRDKTRGLKKSPRVLSRGNIWTDIRGKRVVTTTTTTTPGPIPRLKRIFTMPHSPAHPLFLTCVNTHTYIHTLVRALLTARTCAIMNNRLTVPLYVSFVSSPGGGNRDALNLYAGRLWIRNRSTFCARALSFALLEIGRWILDAMLSRPLEEFRVSSRNTFRNSSPRIEFVYHRMHDYQAWLRNNGKCETRMFNL